MRRISVLSSDLTQREFRDRFARGGYWWTMAVNQNLGAALAVIAIRLGVQPVQLSLLNVLTGAATSAWVLLLHGSRPLTAAIVGLLGWQTAYSLDCADGQVARATARSSPAGAVLDLLSDFFVQITVIFTMLQIAADGMDPTWISGFAVFVTGGWLISPYYGGILGLHDFSSGRRDPRSFRALAKHSRDYGFHVAILPAAMLIGAPLVASILAGIAVLNFLALFVGLTRHGRGHAPESARPRRTRRQRGRG
ncbi:MAG: CDP-alcohol phosphatidyltransferase family protein [Actinomycetota bacterium]